MTKLFNHLKAELLYGITLLLISLAYKLKRLSNLIYLKVFTISSLYSDHCRLCVDKTS